LVFLISLPGLLTEGMLIDAFFCIVYQEKSCEIGLPIGNTYYPRKNNYYISGLTKTNIMDTKKFIIGGIVGGVINFLGGWLFYGMLFASQFPQGEYMDLLMVFLGCMTFGFLLSYIFNKWAGISTAMSGMTAGALLGLILGLWGNFFQYSMKPLDVNMFVLDLGITVALGAITGLAIGFVASKMK
jgi:hypothetical protein